MGASPYRIVPLSKARALVPQLARLLTSTWPEHYGPEGPGFAQIDAKERARPDGLPLGIVALDKEGKLVGSGTLSGPSFGADHAEYPFVIGLCVDPARRQRGIATQIVTALCDIAVQAGYQDIFATARGAEPLFTRLGFERRRTVSDGALDWQVLHRQLLK